MKTILFITILFSFLGCKTTEDINMDGPTVVENPIIKAVIGETKTTSDPITITNIRVFGNQMLFDVTYSGGCEKHEFQIIGSPIITKNLPPTRVVKLIHNANSDACKKLVSETLYVDMRELAYKQEAGSEINLTIEGYEKRINYIFD